MFKPLSLDSRYDALVMSLHHIDSLLTIASSIDTSEFTAQTLNNYFSLAHDLVRKMQSECDALAHVSVFISH